MAGYTKVQLDEVEDQAPNFGLSPDLELRMARVPLDCESCGLSYMRLAPGWRQPIGHRHTQQEEVYILVHGSARMKLDDEIVDLEPWSTVRVAPPTMRGLEAGAEGAAFIVVGAPNTGPGDGEIVPGWWTD